MSASPLHQDMANAIRFLAVDAVQKANSGHPGMPMGMADVATVLFTRFLNFNASNPAWPDRDRFILSAGHGSMLLYALLYLTGYEDFGLEELKNFRQLGYRTAGHPEYGHGAGIETTTGPLGQGIANAVGMALAERMLVDRFGSDLVNHNTYVIAGDGCLMEGISHEAASLAGRLGLGKLIVLFDDNGISIDGSTDLAVNDDQLMRFGACGWDVSFCDGHDPDAITQAINGAHESQGKPSLIACKTMIGFGSPNKAGTSASHGAPLGEDEILETRETLNWAYSAFEIPETVISAWRRVGSMKRAKMESWQKRLHDSGRKDEFERLISGKMPKDWQSSLQDFKRKHSAEKTKVATRKASQETLDVLAEAIPELVGGSADLTGSNLTKAKSQKIVKPGNFAGNYIHYGVREHGMAAAMNGIALHGGFVPYGGTFLIFTDYCRPAIRLSALMKQRVIYVMTHDSIGLGEDGPTHQPVEHLASLRAIPNLNVYRPCDVIETAECWASSLETSSTPSVLSLSRQGLPCLRKEHSEENLSSKGGYVLTEIEAKRDVTLIASGSEVSIAIEACDQLKTEGVYAAVVSMPCLDKFEEQSQDYRDKVIPLETPIVVVEAAIEQSWGKYLGRNGKFVGMSTFGASAPGNELYIHFGITAQNIVNAAKDIVLN
ncbi:MAG: transketolase [SAR324 cluster bacterium]|nr:transketolase [SAR324 cluster bacterium]MED5240911.1 transketolase [SAR324 cluster bacterium]MED5515636.1 transketolase [SAR324 cluster bacterium]